MRRQRHPCSREHVPLIWYGSMIDCLSKSQRRGVGRTEQISVCDSASWSFYASRIMSYVMLVSPCACCSGLFFYCFQTIDIRIKYFWPYRIQGHILLRSFSMFNTPMAEDRIPRKNGRTRSPLERLFYRSIRLSLDITQNRWMEVNRIRGWVAMVTCSFPLEMLMTWK